MCGFFNNSHTFNGEAGVQQDFTLEKANADNMGECFSKGIIISFSLHFAGGAVVSSPFFNYRGLNLAVC